LGSELGHEPTFATDTLMLGATLTPCDAVADADGVAE
jgi:hypothetical protein